MQPRERGERTTGKLVIKPGPSLKRIVRVRIRFVDSDRSASQIRWMIIKRRGKFFEES